MQEAGALLAAAVVARDVLRGAVDVETTATGIGSKAAASVSADGIGGAVDVVEAVVIVRHVVPRRCWLRGRRRR